MTNVALYLQAQETLTDIIKQLEPLQTKFEKGSSQYTLLIRRLMAFHLALDLVKQKNSYTITPSSYTSAQLQQAIKTISSALKKTEKIPIKLRHNLTQQQRLLRQISAYHLALELIEEALQTCES